MQWRWPTPSGATLRNDRLDRNHDAADVLGVVSCVGNAFVKLVCRVWNREYVVVFPLAKHIGSDALAARDVITLHSEDVVVSAAKELQKRSALVKVRL